MPQVVQDVSHIHVGRVWLHALPSTSRLGQKNMFGCKQGGPARIGMNLNAAQSLACWKSSNRQFPASQAKCGAKGMQRARDSARRNRVEMTRDGNQLRRDGVKSSLTAPFTRPPVALGQALPLFLVPTTKMTQIYASDGDGGGNINLQPAAGAASSLTLGHHPVLLDSAMASPSPSSSPKPLSKLEPPPPMLGKV